jgi:hypothetical protein
MLLVTALTFQASAVQPSRTEFEARTAWVREHLVTNSTGWPFSFVLGQRASPEFLRPWRRERTANTATPGRVDHSLTFADPAASLVIRCDVTEFLNHPAVEWVVHFENRGTQDTPLLETVRALDLSVPSTTNGLTLHYARGAVCSFDDFQPLAETLIDRQVARHRQRDAAETGCQQAGP